MTLYALARDSGEALSTKLPNCLNLRCLTAIRRGNAYRPEVNWQNAMG